MSDWSHTLATAVGRWRSKRRMNHQAFSIAREIQPALWENVRRKIANSSAEELTAYARVRAAQLSQECVDIIMRENPTLAGAYATELLVKATDRASNAVFAMATNARQTTA